MTAALQSHPKGQQLGVAGLLLIFGIFFNPKTDFPFRNESYYTLNVLAADLSLLRKPFPAVGSSLSFVLSRDVFLSMQLTALTLLL